ncbi:CHAP domain-containing protein, partial [Staphylococcus arlettae]
QQGNYNYTWQGNWSPNQHNTYNYNYSSYSNDSYSNNSGSYNNYSNQSYTSNNTTGGGGAASNSTSDRNIKVTTQSAPSSSSVSLSSASGSSSNLYTAGQCTYYVYDKVGGKIGSTWGNASNWASAAASSGYTVNNTAKAGSILQSSTGAMGHVA